MIEGKFITEQMIQHTASGSGTLASPRTTTTSVSMKIEVLHPATGEITKIVVNCDDTHMVQQLSDAIHAVLEGK